MSDEETKVQPSGASAFDPNHLPPINQVPDTNLPEGEANQSIDQEVHENLLDDFPQVSRTNEGNQLEHSQKLLLPPINGNVRGSNDMNDYGTKNNNEDQALVGDNSDKFGSDVDKLEEESKNDSIDAQETNLNQVAPNTKKKSKFKKKSTIKFGPKSQKIEPMDDNTVDKSGTSAFKSIDSDDQLSLGGDEGIEEEFNFTDDDEDKTLFGQSKNVLKSIGDNLNPITGLKGLNSLKDGLLDGGMKGLDAMKNVKNIGNMFESQSKEVIETKLETAQDNKNAYLKKYGLSFEVPSEYVLKSIFYPKNANYILQIVNYVVPENQPDYQVETHYLEDRPSEKKQFTDLYSSLITGCALRLVRTNENLTVMDKLDMYVFNEKGMDGNKLQNIDVGFSPCGKYLVISSINLDHIKLYEIENDDVSNIINDVREQLYSAKIKYEGQEECFGHTSSKTEIKFGTYSNYFLIQGHSSVTIYNIHKTIAGDHDYSPILYSINSEIFECIYDVYLETFEDLTYNCYVACNFNDKKRVKIFDIKEADDMDMIMSQDNTINYFNTRCDNFTLRFTNQAQKLCVVLANGAENFTMSESEEIENLFIQKSLMQLGDKEVKFISKVEDHDITENSGFYIAACKDYDEFLHIFKSDDLTFHLTVPRNLQPGAVHVFDIHYDDGILKLLSLKDDQFFVDRLNHNNLKIGNDQKHTRGNGKECNQTQKSQVFSSKDDKQSLMDASASAFSVGWPYICFSGLKNYLLIYNVYQPDVLNRLQLAPDNETIQVKDTFITYTKDLFFIVRKGDIYTIYMIDLDSMNTFEHEVTAMTSSMIKKQRKFTFEPVFEYDAKEVGYLPLDDFFVRGSSRKEVIQLNQKLIIFILHQGCLHYWTEGQKSKDGHVLRKVVNEGLSILSRELVVLDNESFYFCQRSISTLESISEVVQIHIKYNDFDANVISRENCDLFDYIDFKIDSQKMMLLLILKKITSTSEDDPVYIKILNMKEGNKQIFDADIDELELKGILKSGHYTLTDGHMYFRNQVIKMRYEMMPEASVSGYKIEEIFNRYPEILELNENDRIKSKSPLNSIQNHRFAYVILNPIDLVPKRVMIMPYLHERKIFLNRIKKNTQYFYTSIQHEVEIPAPEDSKVPPIKKYHYDFIAVNITESKYYVYSEKGILENRVDFSLVSKQHGDIVSVSPNGLNWVFQKPNSKKVNIHRLTNTKMIHVKSIEIDKAINSFVKVQTYQTDDMKKLRSRKFKHWLYDDDSNIQYKFKVNNGCDICIQIRHQPSSKLGLQSVKTLTTKFEKMPNTLYFFQSGFKMQAKDTQCESSITKEDILHVKKMFKGTYNKFQEAQAFLLDDDDSTLKGQNLMVSNEHSYTKKDFSMDGDRIFFWDKYEIEFYDLKKTFKEQNKNIIQLQVDKENLNSKIKTVEPGDEKDEIAIIVDQVDGALVFSWSIKDNLEYQVFEVKKDHEVLWDHAGQFIIQSDSITTIPVVGCRLKCFTCDNFDNRDQIIRNKELGFQNGYRFDSANHNWMLMYEYVCLSHSYMTFVIQEEIQNIGQGADINEEQSLQNAFDSEAFNYLYNRNHIFMRGDLVKNKFVQFDQILKKLKAQDPQLLQILHYNTDQVPDEVEDINLFNPLDAVAGGLGAIKNLALNINEENFVEKNSALHYAHKIGNNRTVDIILANMADIEENNSEHYQSVFADLIDIKSFPKYLGLLPLSTQQMLDKNILRVKKPLNDTIIAIASSPTLYVDDIFYRNVFKEDKTNPDYKAYPVDILALKIDWIVSTENGRAFLQELQQNERLDYFEIQTLQIIIEFLYNKSKVVMLYVFLPLYLVQFGFFMLTMFCTEMTVYESEGHQLPHMLHDHLNEFKMVIVWGNQILTFIMVSIMIKVFSVMGQKYLGRFYTWCDIMFYSINTVTNYYVLQNSIDSVKIQRVLSSFAILCFLAKTFYYLKLVDQIAPIIDIIIRIVFDIKWFMFVFILSIAAFSTSFFLLGRNQVDYDLDGECFDEDDEPANCTQEQYEELGITYTTVRGALWYGWDLCMGGQGIDGFTAGEASQQLFLYAIYLLFQFIMQIHLLNMLIAYMGETFSKNNEVAEQIKIKDHLSFIMDNWYLKDISLGNVKQIKYIIAALPVSDQLDEDDVLAKIDKTVDEVKMQVKTQAIEQSKKNLAMEEMMRMILYNQEKMLYKMTTAPKLQIE